MLKTITFSGKGVFGRNKLGVRSQMQSRTSGSSYIQPRGQRRRT